MFIKILFGVVALLHFAMSMMLEETAPYDDFSMFKEKYRRDYSDN
jgi:hypothetical protein